MSTGLIVNALRVATNAHKGQMRKWQLVKQEFIIHPIRVFHRLVMLDDPDITECDMAAAILHDTIEDTYVTGEMLREKFNSIVAATVVELTNPSKTFPNFPRAKRKQMDREHLSTISRQAKIIKLIDRIDNLKDLKFAPAKFTVMYLEESEKLLDVLTGTNKELEIEFRNVLRSFN